MRKLVILVLLAVAFCGGYHLGRKPSSPDVLGWARKAYEQVSGWQGEPAGRCQPGELPAAEEKTPDEIVVEVGGKLYRVGSQALAGAWGRK